MRISTKEIWRNLDGLLKNKELWSYVVKFEFSGPKGSSDFQRTLSIPFIQTQLFGTQ